MKFFYRIKKMKKKKFVSKKFQKKLFISKGK